MARIAILEGKFEEAQNYLKDSLKVSAKDGNLIIALMTLLWFSILFFYQASFIKAFKLLGFVLEHKSTPALAREYGYGVKKEKQNDPSILEKLTSKKIQEVLEQGKNLAYENVIDEIFNKSLT